ncbi:uncharacterized protein LOC143022060 isoform X2 [Oratosquilla oratoria]|uniref:uncharacterized protein LOC143022060 isoform X2 n=1 Tax=Oratosquilla oratoria TaxID=337810 RepID=UPI003F76DE8A
MKSPPLEGGEGPCEILSESVTRAVASLPSLMGLTGGPAASTASQLSSEENVMSARTGGGERGVSTGAGEGAVDEVVSVLQKDLVPHTNFTHTFLKSILTSIDSNDPVVANAWLETLLDVIDLLPKDVIKDEILSMAVSKGQSQQVSSRLAACKLLGKIATKFEPFLLKTEVVGVVQSLCQDVSGEVRANMCAQLAPVARGLGLDSTKTHILPELVDLCADEETNVRLAGIHTVVHIIPLLDDETRVGTIVPLVKKICERAMKVEDATLPVTTHLLGQLCHGLHDDFTEEQKQWFLNFYCTTAKMGLPDGKKSELPMPDLVAEVRSGDFEAECRQQCAFNLPGMIVFVGGSKIYRTSLHSTFCSMVADPSNHVRATVAASFHQLCTLVGSEVGLLKDGLLQLLRSESLEILTALTPHLPQILTTMAHHNVIVPSMPVNELVEIVGAVKQGEETVSVTSNWRLHADTLTKFASLAQCLPQQMIFTDLVPLMIIRMHASRPIPCRVAAARTLLIFLHHLSDSEHREHICQTLVTEFCEGSSCHKRMLFLSVCTIVLELFSKGFFKKHFFQPLLSLHADRVANIRLKVVMILPQMKATLTLPEDKTRLQELETVVGSLLMNEGDRDVSAGISNIITQLDKIEVCHSQTTALSRGEGDGAEQRSESHVEGNVKEVKSPIGSGMKTTDRKPTARSSYRHSSGLGSSHVASYIAERRRSGSHAPKQPPDEHTLLRGDGSSNTNEAEPSPWDFEDDDDIDLDDLVDEVLLLSPDEDDVSTSSLGKSGSWDSRRDRFHRDGRSASASQVRDKAPNRRGRDAAAASIKRELSFQDRSSSSGRHSHSRESSSFLREIREANMSTKDLFWLKTSRPKWRRKVASADTSPEMPRRGPFGRGRDGRGSLSDTEEPDFIVYEHPRRRGLGEDDEQGKPLNTDFNRDNYFTEENLPSSPYGINTWPPQHVRHRHHSANDQEEPNPTSYSGGHSSSRNATTTMASTHYDTLHPVHPTKRNSPSSPHQEDVPTCSSLRDPANQRSRDDGRRDLFTGSRTREGFTHEDGEMGGVRSYPSPHSYHHSAMLPPPSSRSSSGLSHAYSSQSLPSQFSYDFTEDYLTSFIYPEPYSPDPYQAAAAAAAAAAERYAADPYQRELHPSLMRMDPYERDSRMCDIRRDYDGSSVYEAAARVGMMGMDSHSCHFLDSAELAPWSSPPAYPIGPLGASWLRHGLPQYPMARIPPCLIPTPYSRPAIRPHHPGGPVSSPPWRLTHHNSLPSMSALDPTTDEFLVDAGIRIDESVMRSRLPTPQASGGGVPRWRPHDRPTSLIPLGLEDATDKICSFRIVRSDQTLSDVSAIDRQMTYGRFVYNCGRTRGAVWSVFFDLFGPVLCVCEIIQQFF